MDKVTEIFAGFSKLNQTERFARLIKMGALTAADAQFLQDGALRTSDLAEKFIENVIGYFQLPLGVATNFRIDGKDFVIPMAVEETSIIAAASKTAKWIRQNGEIQTSSQGKYIIGQIQIPRVKSYKKVLETIEARKQELIKQVNSEVAGGLVRRGGGVAEIQVRQLDRGDGGFMAVVHVLADPCDAMGANIMNQACEFLKRPIEFLTGEKVGICILSNLVDTRLTTAKVIINKVDSALAEKICEAALFAQQDPYRAATNNKGVLNGMDAVLVATGNDWRAVEAGIHAYAARSGQYRSITQWTYDGEQLVGALTAPIIVGTVGGVTRLHPTAKMCLEMIKVRSATDLSRVIAAVGLVQNLGALRALTTEGIIEGHMRLHIKNLALGAGAKEKEIPIVQKRLEELLALRKRISLSHALEVLSELRNQKTVVTSTIAPDSLVP